MTDIDETVRGGRHASRFACFLAVVPIVLITCLVSLMPVDAAGYEPTPTETINGTVSELFTILKEFQGPDPSQARRGEIERVIRRNVRYEDMAKRSLGVSWVQMDDGARTEYVELFVHLLRDSLANRLTQYSGEQITYLSERRESTCAEVKTRLVGSKVDTAIDFRLINQDGRWLVYDAIMDGTSLVGSYRAQFASIIRDASLAQLMERLEEKTLLVKLFETHG
jgi:phospholipid transport system substrate-binding protein